jgi:hypothetical protein
MMSMFGIRPQIVVVSSQSGFLHLIQCLLDTLGLAVRTTSDWRASPDLVECVRPKLVVLDLVPGREAECWLALEAIKARAPTHTTAVLLCPVTDWLLAGHEARLTQHHVYIWREGFNLDELLRTVQVALEDHEATPTA